MTNRIEKLLALMKRADMTHVLIQKPNNMRYLTGYTGEGCLLVSAAETVILTDFRYVEQAGRQAPGVRVVRYDAQHPMLSELLAILKAQGAEKLAVEEDEMTVESYRRMEEKLAGIELTAAHGETEELRMVKDEGEIELIAKACAISCAAFDKMLGVMKAGMTEKEIQIELDYTMLRLGGDGLAFNTIACAGVNGSLPHAIPGDHVVQEGELLTLDFGAAYGGYCADMTRTVAFGKISDELHAIYDTVLKAQLMSLDMVGPGVVCRDVDRCARDYLDSKYPGAFGHSLGHGVGLFIHEQPGLNMRDERKLVPGHIVTVEPGVYLPGVGGCRIEDTVAIQENGYRNLVNAPKELITL